MTSNLHTLLNRGVAEVIERPRLEQLLKVGRKLRVKLGIDPTAPDIHRGYYNTTIKIESGAIQNPTIETVQKIAKALDISLDKLTKS